MKKSKIDLYLPDEIMLKILAPLPAKSIGRCRCVSEKWRNLLSEPNFIKAHLSLSLNKPPRKTLVFDKRSKSFFVVDIHGRTTTDHGDPVVSATQLIKFDIPDHWYLVYRCSDHHNGLVLVGTGLLDGLNEGLFLLNPTTREGTEFPEPPAGSIEDFIFGIGNNKAVAINVNDYSVYVYTFKSNSTTATAWKKLDQIRNSPLDHDGNVFFGNGTKGVLLNGSIYWLGFARGDPHLYPPVLIAFDLTKETIRAVPVPIALCSTIGSQTTLGVVGGSICIICDQNFEFSGGKLRQCSTSKLDVWVMINEYGMEESWTKLSFHKNKGVHRLIFLGNEEFMLISDMSRAAVIYNVNEKSSRDIAVSRLPFNSTQVDYCSSTFVDSLVSPLQLLYR